MKFKLCDIQNQLSNLLIHVDKPQWLPGKVAISQNQGKGQLQADNQK